MAFRDDLPADVAEKFDAAIKPSIADGMYSKTGNIALLAKVGDPGKLADMGLVSSLHMRDETLADAVQNYTFYRLGQGSDIDSVFEFVVNHYNAKTDKDKAVRDLLDNFAKIDGNIEHALQSAGHPTGKDNAGIIDHTAPKLRQELK